MSVRQRKMEDSKTMLEREIGTRKGAHRQR